jgi:hypothetical protein
MIFARASRGAIEDLAIRVDARLGRIAILVRLHGPTEVWLEGVLVRIGARAAQKCHHGSGPDRRRRCMAVPENLISNSPQARASVVNYL